MNKVLLTGHVVNNLDVISEKVGKFTLAVQREYKNKKGEYDTDFFNCVVFNPKEFQINNILKGTKILVEGTLQNNTTEYEGKKYHKNIIVVGKVEISSKPQNTSQNANKPPINEYEDMSIKTASDFGVQVEISPEELPF